QVPAELFDYIQLGLITHTDMVIYIKLLQLYNPNYGYAFPTIDQLRSYTRTGSKATIHSSIRRLCEVGLIKKGKTSGGNNIYVVYKPLDTVDLYNAVPDKVEQFEEFESRLTKVSTDDKERYKQHLIDKEIMAQKQMQIYVVE
ncbi:helix-turn-helix domain-containing protein, partial [Bacillus cereus]